MVACRRQALHQWRGVLDVNVTGSANSWGREVFNYMAEILL